MERKSNKEVPRHQRERGPKKDPKKGPKKGGSNMKKKGPLFELKYNNEEAHKKIEKAIENIKKTGFIYFCPFLIEPEYCEDLCGRLFPSIKNKGGGIERYTMLCPSIRQLSRRWILKRFQDLLEYNKEKKET